MALTVTGVILLILLLPLLLRVGVSCEYGEALTLTLHVGPFSIGVLPAKEKKPKKKAEAAPKEKKPVKKREKKKLGFDEALEFIHIVLDAAAKFREKIVLERFHISFTASGPDAAAAGITYGAAWAIYGGLMPALDAAFRIKSRKIDINLDFEAKKPRISASVKISIFIWQIFVIAASLASGFLRLRAANNKRAKRTV